jgi:hypothetical protein
MIFLADTLRRLKGCKLMTTTATSYQSGKFHQIFQTIYNYSNMQKDLIKD